MHPKLSKGKIPRCEQVIDALKLCHYDHPISKFWGACNDHKHELDRCLRANKKIIVTERTAAARERQADFQEYREKMKARGIRVASD